MKGVPIKFRGKRVKDGKTVYGWAYKSECPMSSFPAIIDYNDKYNAIYPESVAQLVGYDADGNEVYEGDKLTPIDASDNSPKRKGRPKKDKIFIPNLLCNLDLDDYINVTDDYE